MKPLAILQIIAHQLYGQRAHLDTLSQTSEWGEPAKAAYDRASGHQRNMEMAQLEPVADAEPADIFSALNQLGPSLAIEYLQFRGGAYQFAAHKPLYTACLKLGSPDMSWEEAQSHADAAGSMHLKNPQTAVFRGLNNRMLPLFAAFKNGEIEVGDLPYFSDRFYMNGIIRNIQPGDPKAREADGAGRPDSLRLSRLLIGAAFEAVDEGRGSLTLDEELRVCGLVTLACQELPGYSVFDPDWTTEGVTVMTYFDQAVTTLAHRQQYCLDSMQDMPDDDRKRGFLAHDQQQLDDMRELRDRVAAYSGHEIFNNPVTLSHRLYDRFEDEKLAAILRPALAQEPQTLQDTTITLEESPRLSPP